MQPYKNSNQNKTVIEIWHLRIKHVYLNSHHMTYQRSCDLTPGKHKLFSYGQGDSDYCNIFVDVSAMRYIFFYCKKSSINMTCHSRRVFYGLLKIGGGVKDKWEVDVNNVPLPELNTFSFNKRDYT